MIEAAQALAATELETMRLEREARESPKLSGKGLGAGALAVERHQLGQTLPRNGAGTCQRHATYPKL